MNYTNNVKSYLKQIETDILPSSDITRYKQNTSGLYVLDHENSIEMTTQLPDSKEIYSHEKCTPKRLAIRKIIDPNTYSPIYYRYFESGVMNAFSKIIVNSVLNIYPTPLNIYGTSRAGIGSHYIGVSTIDLNNLKNSDTNEDISSIRLDMLLHSCGVHHEIDSFLDFQNILKNDKINKILTPRALVQIGMGTIFIPNAIGEVDPNSRNMILLKNKSDNKYDIAVRIDGESNTYISDLERSRSGKKQVPKGIKNANEDLDIFIKTIQSKDTDIDWDLFSQFNTLAMHFCSRTNIDNAITKAYMSNSGKVAELSTTGKNNFGPDAFYDFSAQTIDRAKRYFDNVCSAIIHNSKEMPFSSPNKNYPGLIIEDGHKPAFLSQKSYSKDGKEL